MITLFYGGTKTWSQPRALVGEKAPQAHLDMLCKGICFGDNALGYVCSSLLLLRVEYSGSFISITTSIIYNKIWDLYLYG